MQLVPFEGSPDEHIINAVKHIWPDQLSVTNDGAFAVETSFDTEVYVAGNKTLPVAKYASTLLDAVHAYDVVISQSATGTGKSTFIPQLLLMDALARQDDQNIFVLQPRIVAAREVAARCALELTAAGLDGAALAGYDTGPEGNRQSTNRLVFATAGKAANWLRDGVVIRPNDIVILDEFHERDKETDYALALCHLRRMHTMIMSATIDAGDITKRTARIRGEERVAKVVLPGLMYPITEKSGGLMQQVVTEYAYQLRGEKESPTILAFLPGRREISRLISSVYNRLPYGFSCYELHGEMTPDDQRRALATSPHGKLIAATNVAATSLTVGADVVVDGGYERKGLFFDGVHQLPIAKCSQAMLDQRKGRTGRTAEEVAIYHRAQIDGYPYDHQVLEKPRNRQVIDLAAITNHRRRKKAEQKLRQEVEGAMVDTVSDRLAYDEPTILTSDISGLLLRSYGTGVLFENLDLPNQPTRASVEQARLKLYRLGAVHADGELTQVGEFMQNISLDPPFARMVYESQHKENAIQLMVVAMCAAAQVKGLGAREAGNTSWKMLTRQSTSDMLAQLDIFAMVYKLQPEDREKYGIVERRFQNALTNFERITKQLNLDADELRAPDFCEQQDVLDCIVSGTVEIMTRCGYGRYRDIRGVVRTVPRHTATSCTNKLIIGSPIDIASMRPNGPKIRSLVVDATEVDLKRLRKILPHRLSYEENGLVVSALGQVQVHKNIYFDGMNLREYIAEDATPSFQTHQLVLETFVEQSASATQLESLKLLNNAMQELVRLQHRTHINLHIEDVITKLDALINARTEEMFSSLDDLVKWVEPDDIRAVVDKKTRNYIMTHAPEYIKIETPDGETNARVTYIHNHAYLTLSTQVIQWLNAEYPELEGRDIFVRQDIGSKYLPIAEAVASSQRRSRTERRATEILSNLAKRERRHHRKAQKTIGEIPLDSLGVAAAIKIVSYRASRGGRRRQNDQTSSKNPPD